MMPHTLRVWEFANIVGLCAETIRRDIRARKIEAHSRPFRIPRRELKKYGVEWADVAAEWDEMSALLGEKVKSGAVAAANYKMR